MFSVLGLLLACKPAATPIPTPVPTQTGSTGDTATTPTADTAEPTPVFDCTSLPEGPFQIERIGGARGYHGLAFDTEGYLVGSDGTSLIRGLEPDAFELYVPNIGSTQQMEYLPDGDLAVATFGPVRRVSPAGNVQVIASNVGAYGLIVGPDGFIYTANESQIHRINPNNGNRMVYVSGIPSPKVINWSPDLTKFYAGTNGSNGQIWVVDVDPVTLIPQGQPSVFASTSNTWHDSLGVDVCGNLYIAEYWDGRLWRVTPDGDASVLIEFPSNQYGHGFVWGSGIGAWDALSAYIPQPYDGNRVTRIELGLPDRRYRNGDYEIIR